MNLWQVNIVRHSGFGIIFLFVKGAKTQKTLSHSGWILCVVLQTTLVLLARPGKILTFSVTKSMMPDIVFTEAFSEYSWQFSGCDLHHCKSFVCLFIPKPGLWLAGKCHSIIRNYWVPNGMNYGLMLEKFCTVTSHLYISRSLWSNSIIHFLRCMKTAAFSQNMLRWQKGNEHVG